MLSGIMWNLNASLHAETLAYPSSSTGNIIGTASPSTDITTISIDDMADVSGQSYSKQEDKSGFHNSPTYVSGSNGMDLKSKVFPKTSNKASEMPSVL